MAYVRQDLVEYADQFRPVLAHSDRESPWLQHLLHRGGDLQIADLMKADVEHDRDWYIILNSEFKKQGINGVDYRLAEAETDENFDKKNFDVPADYISSDQAFIGKNFEKYVKQIDQFPDSFFDIVVVDGRARPSCIAHAINKVKPGGFIIVDNSEREYYFNNIKFDDESWKRKDFPGPIPYTYNFSQTSLFQKIK